MLGLLLWKEGGLIDFGLCEMTSVGRNLNIYANLFTLSEIEEKPRFLFLFSFPVKVFQPIEVLIRCHLPVKSQSLTKQSDALAGEVTRWMIVHKDLEKDCRKRKEMPS